MVNTATAGLPALTPLASCDVSVVIVTWNAESFIGPCLRTVSRACSSVSHEIVVVDNASSDRGASIVEEQFPDVRLVRNQDNVGFARATNQGIRMSAGRFLLLLNPDTTVSDETVTTLMAFMESHPRAAAVGPRMINSKGQLLESYAAFPRLSTALRLMFVITTASYDCLLDEVGHEPLAVDSVGGACMMVRREAFVDVGLLDEQFFMYWEEADLCWRFGERGWQVYYLPTTTITHYVGGSAQKAQDRLFFNGLLIGEWTKSSRQFFRKHYPWWVCFGFFATAIASGVIGLLLSPVLFLIQPSRREELTSLAPVYAKAILRDARYAVEGWTKRTRWDGAGDR